MKRRITIFLTFLFLILSNILVAQKIVPKKINEQLPDLQLKYIYGEHSEMVNLSAFKGKMILIDFWATWCAPCVSSMRFLDSLQIQFSDRLQIICVTREDDEIVKDAFSRLFPNKRPAFLTVTKDTLLEKYLPHQTIPHCVWIDNDGTIKAITDKSSVNVDNIKRMLIGNLSQIKNKPPIMKIDTHKPPYASKQVILQDEFLYHSMITKYREDLKTNYSRGVKNDYIACVNSSIIRLFQCAAGKFDLSWLDMNRVVCKGFKTFADSASIGLFKSDKLINSWKSNIKDYAFTYELAVSDTIYSNNELFKIMQEDLNRYFGIYGLHATKEKGSHKVLALVTINGGKFKSYKDIARESEKYSDAQFLKIVNEPMIYFLSQLQPYTMSEMPLINQTGYDDNVNLSLKFDAKNLLSVNNALSIYGLKIIQDEVPIDVLVITKVQGKKRLSETMK